MTSSRMQLRFQRSHGPAQDVTLLLGAVPAVCQLQVHRAHYVTLQERGFLNHSLAKPHTVPWTLPTEVLLN